MKIGVLPLGRATFDTDFAAEKCAAVFAALDRSEHEIIGPRTLLFDADATRVAMAKLGDVDRILILQITFTDAAMTLEIAERFQQPLSIWAVTEPRIGGRLRLNAFCGLNLAGHALGQIGRRFGWIYDDDADPATLTRLFDGARDTVAIAARPSKAAPDETIRAVLSGQKIGRIGAHPDGFTTCAYRGDALEELTGIGVDEVPLETLFETAAGTNDQDLARLKQDAAEDLNGLERVDQAELDRSLRLKLALDALADARGYTAVAIRCWPETFTEYGGAVCGPVAMSGEARRPCACEADVYGAATQLILQHVADAPVFLADLVDMDAEDDTGVIWHCGQAPISMIAPDHKATATIHTNRRMPLLYEFPLKAGPVTGFRLSQSAAGPRIVIAAGEMLARDMAFTGTSGVIRFDRPVSEVLPDVLNSGLEHHMAFAYGDHEAALMRVAAALALDVIRL